MAEERGKQRKGILLSQGEQKTILEKNCISENVPREGLGWGLKILRIFRVQISQLTSTDIFPAPYGGI